MCIRDRFQCVRAVAWEDILPKDAQVPVCAQCARSQLMSPSDCQSIAKKALAERMKAAYGYQRMPETGAVHQVEVMLHGDIATIALNTSGPALSRRGYRTWNGEAPLRETLAAALALCCPCLLYTSHPSGAVLKSLHSQNVMSFQLTG